MGIGNLVVAVFTRMSVHGAAAEEGAGEAWIFAALRFNRSRDIDVYRIKGDVEVFYELANSLDIKVGIGKHRVDGQCGNREIYFQPFAHTGKRIG